MNNITVCDKFQPTILEGQLCVSLGVAELKEYPTKSGKSNGLLLLLDTKPYQLIEKDRNFRGSKVSSPKFKVFVNTLAQYTSFGPGSYAMNSLKKMTGTKSFRQLLDSQKKCKVHNREDCQTEKYLAQVQKQCKCMPWALQTNKVKYDRNQHLVLYYRRFPTVVQRRRPVLQM